MGIAVSSEAVWTTLLSPLLIITLPLSANELYHGNSQECLPLSAMLANWTEYTAKDFFVQATLKENRLTMWPVLAM